MFEGIVGIISRDFRDDFRRVGGRRVDEFFGVGLDK